ncbi:glycosyl transferase, family 2 [Candidatus Ruthia magnifica str. Cm (Calyptogena magnifica)]|uniref:Glycosyl transferase, family 2 n=1 Tax=Ruthia magnifica subsp. Calyptogena magnifica TaxID=413404 RepID=A1AXE6_RUTMC|nr:glycosyltransferase family 2 protein [Candidatus Ruthturnera calyptogenae]ABL02603.1 glycosyl transferase, family 2 [Candidatus Ruthia magnifica str. Cm (Calyptogena magnifica)]
MKLSIITVVWNNKTTIKDAIDSVLSQNYQNIEYIVIDGGSSDGTIEIIKNYQNKITKFVSEPDKGIYDAMNKGIVLATGDIIGILNSDDFYINKFVIQKIIKVFEKKVDCVFADLVYVRPNNLEKVIRRYDNSYFSPNKFAYGWMPAHPTFFVKKEVYQKYGMFRTDLKNAADFDILVRFLYTYKISYHYLPEVIVKMRIGGVSTSLSSIWINNIETLRVCKENGIKTNIFKILSKYLQKIVGLLKK